MIALNADGGVAIWRQSELLHRNLTSPVLYNGYIVVGDGEGYLHWLNTTDGRFVAQQNWIARASRLSLLSPATSC